MVDTGLADQMRAGARPLGIHRSIGAAMMLLFAITACADRGADLTVVYRGDIAAYRALVRVQLDTGSRARVVTPAFPSAAHAEPIVTGRALPITVSLLTPAGDTAALYSAPPLNVVPKTRYQLGIVIGARPAASPCNGPWIAAAVTRSIGAAPGVASPSESLFVSVTARDRTKATPRCDD